MARKKPRPAGGHPPKPPEQVYQLKITLQHIRPPIWRRVQVADCGLDELHHVIQHAMGWYDCHLHEYEVGGEHLGDPLQWDDGFGGELDVADEGNLTLSQLAADGVKKFRYTYDMGDSWEHQVQIEKVLAAEAGADYPRCVAGKRACPPEDCGGPWGYADFVKAIQDPKHEEHEELREWIGGDFDPEAFSLEGVNDRLR